MKPPITLWRVGLSLCVLAAGAAFADTPDTRRDDEREPSAERGASAGRDASTVRSAARVKLTFSELDRNNDSFLSHDEAAADLDVKKDFDSLDRNRDGKLSREEFEARQE